jgi:hypothetical protein
VYLNIFGILAERYFTHIELLHQDLFLYDREHLLATYRAENISAAAVSINVVNRARSITALHTACLIVVWKTLRKRSQDLKIKIFTVDLKKFI